MAQYIFTDITDFKSFIGKGISASFTFDELGPTILNAAELHLIPWIGQGLWNDMVTAVAGSPTTPQTDLLPYLKRPLAMLTMYEYTQIGEVLVTDQGVMRVESEESKTAYKAQVNNYREYMLIYGYQALEPLLAFLEANTGDYPLWTDADESKRNREAFINTVQQFRIAYSTEMTRYVMENLRGLMLDIEQFAIRPLLGDALFDELKAAIMAKSETDEQKTLIAKIRKAVAYFTVEEGIRQKIVANTGRAIVVLEILEPQGNVRQGSPSGEKLSLALRHHDEFGDRHISLIKNFLDENRDDYPTYKTYIEAIEEAAAEAEAAETTVDSCGNVTTVNKPIFRL